MTPRTEESIMAEISEVLITNGLLGTNQIMTRILNEVMKQERSQALQAIPYERTEERVGYANGYKDKRVMTRFGELNVDIPQTRDMAFYPKSLEKGLRSERALGLCIAEMYVKGVGTRQVEYITKKLCGMEISSTQVSRLCEALDVELKQFRDRPLGEIRYVFLDARYEKIRHGGHVIDMAVLIAIGIRDDGKREILGVSTSLSEAEVHWRKFMESLLSRGLRGVELIISDDHAGLKAARQAVWPSVPWQRCQFHMAQNAQAYVPKKEMRPEIAQAMRDIFNSVNLDSAKQQTRETVLRYGKTAPAFTKWLEENIDEGLTVFRFPRSHWKRIRTTNVLERLNQEIKRRTRVARLFPSQDSCVRLVSAILSETHENWITQKIYLNMEDLYDSKLKRAA